MDLPVEYIGREQAFIKHHVLRSYLTRLFMIVGLHRPVINYVDCFAGPWLEGSNDLADTSVGIAISEMEQCRIKLARDFKRTVKFRALFIEKDNEAAKKLQEFLKGKSNRSFELESIHGEFVESIPKIRSWAEAEGFSFFFVDPKGWTDVDPQTLQPLLSLPSSEFIINLMYDFVNRFVEKVDQKDKILRIFGNVDLDLPNHPSERRRYLLRRYRNNISTSFSAKKNWTSFFPIEKPGQQRVLYYLVYLTSHPKGMLVFCEAGEKSEAVQAQLQRQIKIRKKSLMSGVSDLFCDMDDPNIDLKEALDDESKARYFWLNYLTKDPKEFTLHDFASALDFTDLSPSCLQKEFIALCKEGLAQNHDAKMSRRRTHGIHFDKPEHISLSP